MRRRAVGEGLYAVRAYAFDRSKVLGTNDIFLLNLWLGEVHLEPGVNRRSTLKSTAGAQSLHIRFRCHEIHCDDSVPWYSFKTLLSKHGFVSVAGPAAERGYRKYMNDLCISPPALTYPILGRP